jgi:hypothetical protein
VSAIYYLCCVYHLLLFSILRRLFYLYDNQLYSISHLMSPQPFYIVSALLHTLSPIPCLGQQFYTMSVIFVLYQPFHALLAISMFCQHLFCDSHFNVLLDILYLLSVIFCDIFFWLCVLQVYYLNNLLSNISVPPGTPCCQFFTSDVIDRISNLDREVSRGGSMSFGELPVSKTCFLPVSRHFCHFIVKTL